MSADHLRLLSDRVARHIAAGEPVDALRHLRLAGGFCDSLPAPAVSRIYQGLGRTASDPDRVGIWARQADTGCFIRGRHAREEWHLWASVGRIPPKRAARRIVLIGESVARGYLYDPQFTPAQTVSSVLSAQLGRENVEVVDLARTNLGLQQMAALAADARVLKPDLVIIFAGNNWWPVATPMSLASTVPAFAGWLRAGATGLKAALVNVQREAVTQAVSDLERMYDLCGVPLVWIIPEFNLGDWRDPLTSAPYLPSGQNAEWLQLYAQARQDMAKGDRLSAAARAQSMVECDGGTTVAGFYTLAECAREDGHLDLARIYLEAARDAQIWTPFQKAPRAYGTVQEVLRRARTSSTAVDLPAVFRDYLAGDLPDRRVFLDYCHLTVEGIRVAAAAAASAALYALGKADVPWRDLLASAPVPPGSVQAEGFFLGAVHCAHYEQRQDLIEYYIAEALRASPEITEVMSAFIDVQAHRSDMWTCRAAERIANMKWPSISHYLLRANQHRLDKNLLTAILDCRRADTREREVLQQVWIKHHSVKHHSADLLDPYYYSSQQNEFAQPIVWDESTGARTAGEMHYRAYSQESRFTFVAEAGCSVRITVAYRLPTVAVAEGFVEIELNGYPQGMLPIGHNWERHDLRLDTSRTRSGVNDLTLRWPVFMWNVRRAFESVGDRLVAGQPPEYFPVFGEVHSLIAYRCESERCQTGVASAAIDQSVTAPADLTSSQPPRTNTRRTGCAPSH